MSDLRDHPIIAQLELKGEINPDEYYGVDALDNDVFVDEEIYTCDGEFYLAEALSGDAIRILEQHGGVKTVARRGAK